MLGSVLEMLCFHILPGSPAVNLDQVWAHICQYYTDNHVATQFSQIRVDSFYETNSYPELKDKGAEVKDLVPALLFVWLQFMDIGTESHRSVKDMLEGKCLMQDILSNNKEEMFLPTPDAQLSAKTISEVLIKCSLLASIADEGKLLLWNITPKFHYLFHLGQEARYLNPRKGCTFLDESWMGTCND